MTTSVTSIRLPLEIQKELDAVAARMDRSRAWVIQQAVTAYLEMHQKQQAHIARAMSAANGGAPAYSEEGVDAVVQSWFKNAS